MREALRFRIKDILQRLAELAVLFVVTYVGIALGVSSWPSLLVVAVVTFGVVTLLWVLDPAFQDLYNDEENEEVEPDGNVA